MPLTGYSEYRSRTFCNDVKCPVQMALNSKNQDSKVYAMIKQKCEKMHIQRERVSSFLSIPNGIGLKSFER